MFFGSNCQNYSIDDTFCMLQNEPLKIVTTFSYLGFILDPVLTFQYHFQHVQKKLALCNATVYRIRNFIDNSYTSLVFNAIGLSYINYCGLIISNFRKKDYLDLDRCYTRSGCVLFNCKKSDLGQMWLDLKLRILIMRYLFLDKIFHCEYAPVLTHILPTRRINYYLRNDTGLMRVRFMKASSQKAFMHWAVRLWSLLPVTLRNVDTLSLFKRNIYIWLLENIDSIDIV